MKTKISLSEYPARFYRASHQLSIHFIEQSNLNKKPTDHDLCFSEKQRVFFDTLLKLPGVIKYSVSINEIMVYKWPGFNWKNIEPNIIRHIKSCTIDKDDLEKEIANLIFLETDRRTGTDT